MSTEIIGVVARQIEDELGAAAGAIGAAFGPDVAMELDMRLHAVARSMAVQIAQDDDDKLAAQTVIDLMCALWPHGAPEDHDPTWWRTPLGRMVARSIGRDDSDAVTYSVAAAMLGVTKGTVSQMVHRGNLDRHPDGGIARASVLRRLARNPAA